MTAADSYTSRAQLELGLIPDRLEDYRNIKCPCLIIAFADDLVVPPRMCREVADSIPGSTYTQIADCGHYGYLERPAAVNDAIISFLSGLRRTAFQSRQFGRRPVSLLGLARAAAIEGRIPRTSQVLLNVTGGGRNLLERDHALIQAVPDLHLSRESLALPESVDRISELGEPAVGAW